MNYEFTACQTEEIQCKIRGVFVAAKVSTGFAQIKRGILAGSQGSGIDFDVVQKICEPIRECVQMGVQIGLVVGGGNFWRGRSSGKMDRTRADHMGMLATVMNALGVAEVLEQMGVDCRVQTAMAMPQVAELYVRNKAVRHLEKGRVTVFGCGTGNPFFLYRYGGGPARSGNRRRHYPQGNHGGRRV